MPSIRVAAMQVDRNGINSFPDRILLISCLKKTTSGSRKNQQKIAVRMLMPICYSLGVTSCDVDTFDAR